MKGTSLQFQEEVCRNYCRERGIEVLEVFRDEGVSAKTADRAALLRALEYCRTRRGTVQAFVVAKVDRFARNTEDHFFVRKRLLDHGVVLQSVSEPIGNSPTEKFVETVLAASSEFDNAVRRQRCTDGMLSRLRAGIWPFRPPLGYLCSYWRKRGEKKNQPDAPDPEAFPVIQQALKEYAAGLVRSQADLAQLLDSRCLSRATGKQTTLGAIDRIVGAYLPFYAGLLINPWTGEEHDGAHEPMITPEEMRRIRLVRSGKAGTTTRDRRNPLFPLRRTVLCGACGRPYTGGVTRGGSGRRYAYYQCANKTCDQYGRVIAKKALEEAFAKLVDLVLPSDVRIEAFERTLVTLCEDERLAER